MGTPSPKVPLGATEGMHTEEGWPFSGIVVEENQATQEGCKYHGDSDTG